MLLWDLLFQSDLKVHYMGLTFFVGVSRSELTNEVLPKLPCVYRALCGAGVTLNKAQNMQNSFWDSASILTVKDVRKCNPYFIQKGKCGIVGKLLKAHKKTLYWNQEQKSILLPGQFKKIISSSLVFLL